MTNDEESSRARHILSSRAKSRDPAAIPHCNSTGSFDSASLRSG